MDTLQAELEASYPILDIQIVGINEAGGYDVANDQMTSGRSLPWLQDVDNDGNQVSDVWYDSWDVTYRDVVIVNGQSEMVDVYNLTVNDLQQPADYAAMRDKLIDAAMTEQKPWQNQVDRFDVNNDGHIVPLDVLLMVNEIDATGPGKLAPPTGTSLQGPFWDCDGDNYFAPIDILQVVNRVEELHGQGNSQAEGEGSIDVIATVPTSRLFVSSTSTSTPSQNAAAMEDVVSVPTFATIEYTRAIMSDEANHLADEPFLQVEQTDDEFWASYRPIA